MNVYANSESFYLIIFCVSLEKVGCKHNMNNNRSVLRHKFLILDNHHTDILYKREQGCEGPWLFLEAKRGT